MRCALGVLVICLGCGSDGSDTGSDASVQGSGPSVTITSPQASAVIDGTVVVQVTATDDVGIVDVSLQIDGAASGTVSAEPYTFSWDTAASGDGTHTLTATATDTDGNVGTSSAVVVTVQAGASNHAPVASAASLNGTEDTTLSTSIASSANDQDADALTFSVVTMPTKGTLTLGTDGTVTYVPDGNANGSDSFTYRVNDGALDSNEATADITIAAVNDTPVAMADSITTAEDTPATGTVTGTDVDMTNPTFTVYALPSKGTVSIDPTTGDFTYTPTANANGADSFTFRASDGTATSSPATISITITPVNDAPVAASFTLDVLDGPTQVQLGTDVDGDALTVEVISQPTNGTFNGTGALYTYSPSIPTLGTTDTIVYRVTDGTTPSSNATISVVVAGLVREYGTTDFDTAYDIAEDASGNIFVVGKTSGAFPTFTNAGNTDPYVRKYDASWNVVWTQQFGGSSFEDLSAVAVSSAGVFVGGQVTGDAFLRKYDTDGNTVWTVMVTSDGTFNPDSLTDIAFDAAGNIYVVGTTKGAVPASGGLQVGVGVAFVRKYDSTGAFVWENKAASSYWESASAVGVDAAGNVYSIGFISSYWNGAAGFGPSYRHWVRKHSNATGARVWEKQIDFSSSDVSPPGATVDSNGNVFLTGDTPIVLAGSAMIGGRDAYLRKYDTSGSVIWTKQFGTTMQDNASAVTLGASGELYVAGKTYGAFANKTNNGQSDVFIAKFDSSGNTTWTRQFGTNSFDEATAIELGAAGSLLVCGYAFADFPGETNAGNYDGYFMKLQP